MHTHTCVHVYTHTNFCSQHMKVYLGKCLEFLCIPIREHGGKGQKSMAVAPTSSLTLINEQFVGLNCYRTWQVSTASFQVSNI